MMFIKRKSALLYGSVPREGEGVEKTKGDNGNAGGNNFKIKLNRAYISKAKWDELNMNPYCRSNKFAQKICELRNTQVKMRTRIPIINMPNHR